MNFNNFYNDDSEEFFDSIIDKFNLEATYKVYQNEQDEIVVNEEWRSDNSDRVKVNRFFKFDPNFIDLIKDHSKKREVLDKVLELYIDLENYEGAVIIREIIKEQNL